MIIFQTFVNSFPRESVQMRRLWKRLQAAGQFEATPIEKTSERRNKLFSPPPLFRMRQNVFDFFRAEEPHDLPPQGQKVSLHGLRFGLPRKATPGFNPINIFAPLRLFTNTLQSYI